MQIDWSTLTFTFPPTLRKPCVYLIRNVYTKDFYVGSTVRVKRRWWDHRDALKKGEHHSRYLQRAWNKYGADAFEFFVAGYYDRSELFEIEQWWLDNAKCVYNGSRRADRPEPTPEGRERAREAAKKTWADPARRQAARERALKQNHLPRGPMDPEQVEKLKAIHRAKNRVYEAFGRKWALKELAEEYKVHYGMLKDRLRAGWPLEKAVLTPKRKGGL